MLEKLFLIPLIGSVVALENGLSVKPPMGWNSWNAYGCDINETNIISAAEKIIELGLDKVGYEYVVMDDCYQEHDRDPDSHRIVPNAEKFPSGIKNMSDRIHDLGLKFGMYSSAGRYTCGGYPGSLGYEEIDADTYADYEVDYLKYDNCYNEGNSGTPQISYARYNNMSQALNATGRPMLYSLCNWGEDAVWNWGSQLANIWRISGDIYDSFDRYDDRCPCQTFDCNGLQGFHCSVTNIIEKAVPLGQKASSGYGWNDLDILEVGNGGMSYNEYVAHFTIWSILKSPLMLGNVLSEISDEDLSIVSNQQVIAINQDVSPPAARMWKRDVTGGSIHLFLNALSDDTYAATVFNSGSEKESFDIKLSDLFFDHKDYNDSFSFDTKELWTNETETVSGNFSVELESHSAKIWKLSPLDWN